MLEVLIVLTVLNTALAAAALTVSVLGWKRGTGITPVPPVSEEDGDTEGKPFKLSDAKMQEGIANLLGYQVGNRGGEEE